MAKKRKIEVLILSDVHLGTYGCHARELYNYLKTIKPACVVLNGDIIDIWQFSKSYWPPYHMRVVKHIMGLISKGVSIYYVTGNHDEMLRKFTGFRLENFRIVNKLVLRLNGKKTWIFHGDVFDITMKHAKWLTKLGAIGYDMLILINAIVNVISEKFGKGKISLSKRIKNSVKRAVKYINNFEQVVADIGADNGYQYVACGHIHQPVIKEMESKHGKITYLNSGDWIENLTSLEYYDGNWVLYRYAEDLKAQKRGKKVDPSDALKENKEIFKDLINEFIPGKS